MLRLLLIGGLRSAVAFLLGVLAVVVVGVPRLDVPVALLVAFAAGCLAALASTPGHTQMAEVMAMLFLGAGVAAGGAVSILGLGVPTEYFAGGRLLWLLGAVFVGWFLVAVPRGRRTWRGRS